jgi:hypothetical protein
MSTHVVRHSAGSMRVAIVRDANSLFVVLIEVPPAG